MNGSDESRSSLRIGFEAHRSVVVGILYYLPHTIVLLVMLPAIIPCLMLAYLVFCSLLTAMLERVPGLERRPARRYERSFRGL